MSDMYLVLSIVGGALFIHFISLVWPKKRLTPEDIEKENEKIAELPTHELCNRYYTLQTKLIRKKLTHADRIIYRIIEEEMSKRELI